MTGKGIVLLTGGTGFLGTMIAKRLLEDGHVIMALVRARDKEAAELRLRKAWWDWPRLSGSVGEEIMAIPGDMTQAGLGLMKGDRDSILSSVNIIINAAADLRLNEGLETLRETNVNGVGHLLELAREIDGAGGLLRFSHVSTAYVCGRVKGDIDEGGIGTEFNSNYERSKAEGEKLVRKVADLRTTIFRPVMVVGETGRGWIRTFNTLYYPLRLYLTGRLRFMPMDPGMRVNLVPGDVAADAIVRMTMDPLGAGRIAHIVPPEDMLPTVRELVDLTRDWSLHELGASLPRLRFMNLPRNMRDPLVRISGRMSRSKGSEGDLTPLLAYLEQGQRFRRDTLDELVGRQEFDWRDLLRKTLSFGTRYGFMHRSERTVHEQMLFRLERRRRPTTLFDVFGGRAHERDATETAEDVRRAARALVNLGIGKGDRVMVVGLNAVRYLTVEGAIGLAGGVSVPLYYTSPVSEMGKILEDCGAKLLLIGSPRLLHLHERFPDVRCVSFCRTPAIEGIMAWDEFLEAGNAGIELPGVGFDDIATIRYTSGTTGDPRGVVFDHGNLRWMAETIASLPPWKARNQEVSYLSFLPMNHVVEGVLGTYSPYYAPAPLRLHFLDDFGSLPEALRLVRPSVFFSVPRFYEKLWRSFQDSPLGKLNDHLPEGSRRLRGALGRTLLRRAGLDRCQHLIVGSAPCSDGLLLDLRSIGVEVHNAYGLTEAPLITLNRVGRNGIGTVGEPLPETELSISSDGEVMVKGHQVMRGYHPVKDGEGNEWLRTGDLGCMTSEGSLVIEGRIKEVMINSYGKNIMPVKVESIARQIPGVVDAMLVVDGRPYASIILWVDDKHLDEPARHWDEQMGEVGRSLSDPERPKAWAVLRYDLEIEKGDVTANLKLRRGALLDKHASIVRAFYCGEPAPEGVIHLGRERRT